MTVTAQDALAWMRESFDVFPSDGKLVWKCPPHNHPDLLGIEAGCVRPNRNGKKYCHIKKNRVGLKRGRLIFLWVHGHWPEPCVDHIDGDSTNDRISNLREATVLQNAWNHKTRARRIALPMGVRRINGSGRYEARIAQNKRMLHLGSFETPQEAEKIYQAKRKELFGEFA